MRDSDATDDQIDSSTDKANRRQVERREASVDRRTGADRRVLSSDQAGYQGIERRAADRRDDTGLERRRGPGRRRTDDRRSAEEGEMTTEQFEFVMAIETYKKLNKRMFPTWTEILEVVEQLGYRKVEKREIILQDVPEPALFDPTLPIDEAA